MRAVLEERQRAECQLSPRGFGGQKKQLVKALPGHRLEQREHRAHGLADACGGLRHQAFAGLCGFINRLGQFTLPRPETGVRKSQRVQRCIARQPVRQLLVGPSQEVFALCLEIFL